MIEVIAVGSVSPTEGYAILVNITNSNSGSYTRWASIIQREEYAVVNHAATGTGVNGGIATIENFKTDFTRITTSYPTEAYGRSAADNERFCQAISRSEGESADGNIVLNNVDGIAIPAVTIGVFTNNGDCATTFGTEGSCADGCEG